MLVADFGSGCELVRGEQMNKWSGLGKFAAGSAVVVVLSLGLCGISMAQRQLGAPLAIAGLLGFLAGGLGLVVSALIAIVMAISGGKTQPRPGGIVPTVRAADPPPAAKDDNQNLKDDNEQ